MNRKVWKQPLTVVQKFMPNEYVAACGDSGVVYKFRCDAGDGVYGSDWFGESGYHACQATHEADSSDEFVNGYYCAKGNTKNPVQVVVWKEPRGGWWPDNIHCTTNLDQDSWETAKS